MSDPFDYVPPGYIGLLAAIKEFGEAKYGADWCGFKRVELAGAIERTELKPISKAPPPINPIGSGRLIVRPTARGSPARPSAALVAKSAAAHEEAVRNYTAADDQWRAVVNQLTDLFCGNSHGDGGATLTARVNTESGKLETVPTAYWRSSRRLETLNSGQAEFNPADYGGRGCVIAGPVWLLASEWRQVMAGKGAVSSGAAVIPDADDALSPRDKEIRRRLSQGDRPPHNISWEEFYKGVRDVCEGWAKSRGKPARGFGNRSIQRRVKQELTTNPTFMTSAPLS